MPIKLLALDIDGTLTDQPSRISRENLQAIQAAQRQGVFVTVATGRGCHATRPIWHTLHIDGPVIQYGGAWIVDVKTEETLFVEPLDPLLVQEILEYAHALQIHAHIYQGDTVIYERDNAFVSGYIGRHNLPNRLEPEMRSRLYENVPKVLAYAEPEEEAVYRQKFTEYLAGRAAVSRSVPGFIEINGLHATKGQALAHVAKLLGIQQEETAAIGDNYLDQDMIEWAGTGVCVADGAEEVQRIADVVVPSCGENGVAYYIENYVLK